MSKIVFFGTPEFAAIILKKLVDSKYKPIACITQPDKKVGREQKIIFSPVKKIARTNKIPVFQFEKLKDQKNIEKIKKLNPELIIVAAYGKIIPREILEIPKLDAINIHPSLLPKYRGASPIQSVILSGEKETGVTLMKMTEKMDAGPIFCQKNIKIHNDDTSEILHNRLAKISGDLLLEKLPEILSNKVKFQPQNESKVTYTKILKKEDGKINWRDSAEKIERQGRAFYPWPGILTYFLKNNKKILVKIKKILISNLETQCDKKFAPGEIFKITNQNLVVFCGKGSVILKRIQIEGKKEISGSDFLRGYPKITKFENS